MKNYFVPIATAAVLVWMTVSLMTVVLCAWFGSRANVGSTPDAGAGHGIYLFFAFLANAIPSLILGAVLASGLSVLWQGRKGLWFLIPSVELALYFVLIVTSFNAVLEGGGKAAGFLTTGVWLCVGLFILTLAGSADSAGSLPFSFATAFSKPVLLRLGAILFVSGALTLMALRWDGPNALISWPALERAGLTGMPRHPDAVWSIYDEHSNFIGRLEVAHGKLYRHVADDGSRGQCFVQVVRDLKRQTWEASRLAALQEALRAHGYSIQENKL